MLWSLLAKQISSSDRIRPVGLLSTRLVARLLLSLLVAHNALIGTVRRLGLGLWHALLTAMFAALILYTFQIVFLGHAIGPCFISQVAEVFSRVGQCNSRLPVP
jgi:hypothetical protein